MRFFLLQFWEVHVSQFSQSCHFRTLLVAARNRSSPGKYGHSGNLFSLYTREGKMSYARMCLIPPSFPVGLMRTSSTFEVIETNCHRSGRSLWTPPGTGWSRSVYGGAEKLGAVNCSGIHPAQETLTNTNRSKGRLKWALPMQGLKTHLERIPSLSQSPCIWGKVVQGWDFCIGSSHHSHRWSRTKSLSTTCGQIAAVCLCSGLPLGHPTYLQAYISFHSWGRTTPFNQLLLFTLFTVAALCESVSAPTGERRRANTGRLK